MIPVALARFVFFGCVCAALTLGHSQPSHADASIEATALAKERFARGLTLYDQGDFRGALGAFESSVDVYASPNSILYIARCLRALSRFAEAVASYERTVQMANNFAVTEPRYRDTAAAAAAELAQTKLRVGRIAVTVLQPQPSTCVFVGDKQLAPSDWGAWIAVDPGEVKITAKNEDKLVTSSTIWVQAGADAKVELSIPTPVGTIPSAPRERSQRSPWVYPSVAVATMGVGAFAAFAILAKRTHATLASRCPEGFCRTSQDDLINRGQTYQTLANVGLAVGALGLGASAWFWWKGHQVSAEPRSDGAFLHIAGPF